MAVAASRSWPRTTRSMPWRRSSTTTDEPVGPVAVTVADRRGRRLRRPRRRSGPTIASIQRSVPPPSAARRTGPSRPRFAAVTRAAGSVPAAAVCVPPTCRRSSACSRSRRRRSTRAAGRRAAAYGSSSSDWRDRPRVGDEPEPGQVLEQGHLEGGAGASPVVVLDAQQHPAARSWPPAPRPRSRWRRGRGAGSPSGPARTGSTRPACPARPVARRQSTSSSPREPARVARSVGRLERAGRRHQATVEREQVGLRQRAGVGHRHPEQDLALALGVADRTTPPRRPWPGPPRGRARPAR